MSEPMTLQDLADKLEAGFQRLTVAFKDAIGIPTVDASAPTTPGEGHRTGTGGPDAPGASEGLDAAIEAAAEALWRHAQRGQFDKLAWADIPDHWRPEKFEQAEAAVRAAEPILRQTVAEDIARRIEERNAQEAATGQDYDCPGGHECPFGNDLSEAADVAREVGRAE